MLALFQIRGRDRLHLGSSVGFIGHCMDDHRRFILIIRFDVDLSSRMTTQGIDVLSILAALQDVFVFGLALPNRYNRLDKAVIFNDSLPISLSFSELTGMQALHFLLHI